MVDNRQFLFVGRLEEMKGIELVVHAFEQLPELTLCVAGEGPLKAPLQQYAKEKGLANIRFLGQLDKKQLDSYYAGSTALVVASQWYEGFPMVITEAYAHGLPVIAGNIGNMGSLIEDGKTGVLYAYDSREELRRAVSDFAGQEHSKMRQCARAYYEKRLSPQGNLAILEQIYKDILENKH